MKSALKARVYGLNGSLLYPGFQQKGASAYDAPFLFFLSGSGGREPILRQAQDDIGFQQVNP